MESWNSVVIQQYCVVSKQRMLLSDDLCNAHLLTSSVAFSSALEFQLLLFGLIDVSSLCLLTLQRCDVF